VHPLVRPVLLGVGGQDPLVLNAHTQPPHVELREAMNPGRGEGDAVVGADGARQAGRAKEPVEDRAPAEAFRREEAVAGEEVAGVRVGNREGVAVDPIPGAEGAREVGRPEIVGLERGCRDDAGMLIVAPPAPLFDEPPARQEITGGADRGPVPRRMPGSEPGHELGRSPAGMRAARRADHRRDGRRDAGRTLMRRAAPIAPALAAFLLEPVGPLVAGLPTDAESRAELDHCIEVQPVITDEALALFHR
jgi:hypothetical protein